MVLVKIYNALLLVVSGLLFVTALSGCMGWGPEVSPDSETDDSSARSNAPDRDSSEPAPEPKPTSEFGTIKGQVVDDGFEHVGGALVTVTNDTGLIAEEFTDKHGKYTINDLVPGVYGIRFEAECCETSTDRVRVIAGEVASVSPVLEVWSNLREPYASQVYEYEGFISCDAAGGNSILTGLDYGCEYDPNHNSSHGIEVTRGIKSLLIGLDWDSGFNLNDCLYLLTEVPFAVAPNGHHFHFPADLVDSGFCQEKPIELRLDASEMWENNERDYDFDNITDWMPIQFEVYANGPINSWEGDLFNVVVQHPFTIYWQEYYWEHAPDDATVLPE